MSYFKKLNPLNLAEIEREIDFLISISDNPSDDAADEIATLIKLANSLGTRRKW
jgi:hypothetical protein